MGFFDSIKDALGGEGKDERPADARHVDRDADPEAAEAPRPTGGKHAARDQVS
jgi:hypothetical protein